MGGTKKRAAAAVMKSPSAPAQMKYGAHLDVTRATAKGTKPLPDPTTVGEILTKVVVHVCKRILFVPPKIRLTAYAVLFFFASLVADYMPFPKSWFSDSGNVANQYFVKFSWGWTFVLVASFIFLTTSVYCGGDRRRMLQHYSRLVIATLVWYVWTNLFRVIEEATGQCVTGEGVLYSVKGRRVCASKNGKWTSIDISGHAFLLMWCVLFITEEARAILGWDSIKDFIRQEDHNRKQNSLSSSSSADLFGDTPLNNLTPEEFDKIRESYGRYAFLANLNLVVLTALVLLWDVMMVATALYFHSMIEKVIGALIAALMWFVLYHGYYKLHIVLSPGLPGVGLFKYSPVKSLSSSVTTTSSPSSTSPVNKSVKAAPSSSNVFSTQQPGSSIANKSRREQDLPQFMGMPLYGLRGRLNDENVLSEGN